MPANKSKNTVSSLQDIADLANVSRATVSRALNDSPLISQKTKDLIKQLADEHGYTINTKARDLRLSRTNIITVVFMLDVKSKQHMSEPFFLEMLGGIADSLSKHDYDLLLAHAPIKDVATLWESGVVKNSDGLIFIGQGELHKELNKLARKEKNMVVWGYPVKSKRYVTVGGDNVGGGYQMTRHLLELGHRKIVFFGKTVNPENLARYEGYCKALREFGLTPDDDLKFDVPFEMHGVKDFVADLLAMGTEFDAIVCVGDVMALATISTLQEQGIRVPEDVSVVGYDDISLSEYSSPPLTTVRQNIHWAGKIVAESLLSLINGEQVADITLNCELVVRKSTCQRP